MNIKNIMAKAARRRNWTGYRYLRRNMKFGLEGGALRMSWKGRTQGYLGAPIEALTGIHVPEKAGWAISAALFAGSAGMMAAGMNPLALILPAIPMGAAAIGGGKKVAAYLEKSAAAKEAAEDAEHAALFAPTSSTELSFKVEKKSGELITKHEVQIFKGEEKVGWLSGTREAGSSKMLIDEAELFHEYRGQGLGKQMYSRLFESAQEANLTSVVSGGVVSEDAQNVWRSFAKKGAPIVEEMGKAGPTFNIDLTSFVADHHLAPRVAKIEGLAERGMAKGIRKLLTVFGSGWQGLSKGMSVDFEKAEEGANKFIGVLKSEGKWAGYMTYSIKPGGVAVVGSTEITPAFRGKGFGKELYGEAMKHAKAQGAIKFRSDIKIHPETGVQAVSENAAGVWGSAERAGIAQKIEGERGWVTNLLKLDQTNKGIMKLGEGSAIAKAGVAEVPSVLKNTARMLRNAL